MPVLLDLPAEVLAGVTALLPRSDIKAVRWTCKRLYLIASPGLYSTLYLSCHDLDLYVFQTVSDNPLLISSVTELIVDDTTVSTALLDLSFYQYMASHPELWQYRNVPYFPRDGSESWDEDGRVWSPTADPRFHHLLMRVYENHDTNRRTDSDVVALREALPRMTSLHTLVLSNRTADDTPLEGAQSQFNSSPVAKLWREVGEAGRERPPFPPRVDWYHSLQDDQFESDEVFQPDWLLDGFQEYILMNGMPDEEREVEELGDDTENEDGADDNIARSDDGNASQDQASPGTLENRSTPQQPTFAPIGARALRRESRGLQVILDILSDPTVRSRLGEFRVDASLETISAVQQPGLSMRLFDFVSPPFARRLATSFSDTNITKFDLVLSNGRDSADGQAILDQGQVGGILAAMPRLTDLSIEGHNLAVIGMIQPNFVFSRLKRASFFCGSVSPNEVRHFVHRHSGTLEHLSFAYCSIDRDDDDQDPEWEEVVSDLRYMQATGITSLQSATLVSAYSAMPFTGCGRNKTKSVPRPGDEVYSWTWGVDENIVPCPPDEMGHREQ